MAAAVPKDVASWQLTTDIQQLRKEAQGLSKALRQQKEVGVEGVEVLTSHLVYSAACRGLAVAAAAGLASHSHGSSPGTPPH